MERPKDNVLLTYIGGCYAFGALIFATTWLIREYRKPR